jgi:hypothetical protein
MHDELGPAHLRDDDGSRWGHRARQADDRTLLLGVERKGRPELMLRREDPRTVLELDLEPHLQRHDPTVGRADHVVPGRALRDGGEPGSNQVGYDDGWIGPADTKRGELQNP